MKVLAGSADRSPTADGAAPQIDRIKVWDLPVRLVHWSFVALVTIALVTGFFDEPSTFDVHIIAGSAIAALVMFRIVWGFTGSTHARFSNFVRNPLATLRHLLEILKGHAGAHTGHNPIAAMMILALLTVLIAATATGVIVLGGVFKDGPAAPYLTFATAREVKELHEALAFALLGLIALHVAGVLFESLRSRENLARAMVTGWKQRREASAKLASARPGLAAALTAALLLSIGGAITYLSLLPAHGVPAAPMPAIVVKECKSCHAVHHPSLATKQTWQAVMAGLAQHFGENASLEEPVFTEIKTYLESNAAESFDTKPANVLRRPDKKPDPTAKPEDALRITARESWKRLHRDVPEAAFKEKPVGGKLNCTACHLDAESGRFSPRNITIPKTQVATQARSS